MVGVKVVEGVKAEVTKEEPESGSSDEVGTIWARVLVVARERRRPRQAKRGTERRLREVVAIFARAVSETEERPGAAEKKRYEGVSREEQRG